MKKLQPKKKSIFIFLFVSLICFQFQKTQAQTIDSLVPLAKDSVGQLVKSDATQQDSLQKQNVVDTSVVIKLQTSKSEAKSYIIEGIVKDFTTAEPMAFATVFFKNTALGKRTDIEGKFSFKITDLPSDTLGISMVGYAKKFIVLNKSIGKMNLNIELERAVISIKDVVIRYDRNPGLTFIKKVIKAKPQNDFSKVNNYSCEIYNKLELDVNKIPKAMFKSSLLLKKFDFIEKYIDSTSEEKPFLPLFLSETMSDYYFQRKPQRKKEFIKGSRISGFKNESVSKLLGGMYQKVNVYDNIISIFDLGFVSPIANDAAAFYRYEITDTQVIENKLCYQVVFSPKRKGEHTFNGDFWIHDTDYAVQKVNMIVTKEQSINFVNKVTMMQEFTCIGDTLWFLTKDKFYVDFLPPQGDKVAGFVGRKTATYKDILVNNVKVDSVVNDKKLKVDLIVAEEANNRNEAYWNEVRHDSLTKNEKAIYQMIDTIQHLPIYKKYYNAFYFLGTGIREIGPIELGSFYNLYSRNPYEGSRFRFNVGTTPKLFKNIYIKTYAAYGTKDKRWKYDGQLLYLLNRKPRRYVFAEYQHDVENSVNQYDDVGSIDNIFNALARKRGVPWKLAFVEKQRVEFFNSFFSGFSQLISIERKSFDPYRPLPSEGIFQNPHRVRTAEIGLELRLAYREQFVEGNYFRASLGTKFPIVKLYLAQGIKGFLNGQYQYTKSRIIVSDNVRLSHYGKIHYNLFAGKTFGTVPYPLLEIHPGNEFYYYAHKSFSMMNRFEYISDAYAGAIVEHSMGSLFLKYIPLVQKMKIRTFWNAKGVYGSLSKANQQLNLNKGFAFQTLTQSPYLEIGTGAENILKVLRIDFVWRVMPRNTAADIRSRRFGIFGSFKFAF
jgi:hypothetical protein